MRVQTHELLFVWNGPPPLHVYLMDPPPPTHTHTHNLIDPSSPTPLAVHHSVCYGQLLGGVFLPPQSVGGLFLHYLVHHYLEPRFIRLSKNGCVNSCYHGHRMFIFCTCADAHMHCCLLIKWVDQGVVYPFDYPTMT